VGPGVTPDFVDYNLTAGVVFGPNRIPFNSLALSSHASTISESSGLFTFGTIGKYRVLFNVNMQVVSTTPTQINVSIRKNGNTLINYVWNGSIYTSQSSHQYSGCALLSVSHPGVTNTDVFVDINSGNSENFFVNTGNIIIEKIENMP
jgi:hypothetical protein